jgi:putative spermidine/putrescine transport system permease protein
MINRKIKRAIVPYLLILPACVLLLIFLVGLINGIVQGFGIMPFLGMYEPTLDYYIQAFTRSDLSNSILYSLYLALASTAIAIVIGVALSAALCKIQASRAMQLLGLQVPIMTAHMLVAICVMCLLSGTGLVQRLLVAVGLESVASCIPSVVGNVSGYGILGVYAWKEIPWIAFCVFTIMSGVSSKFGEAASVLGAGTFRTFFEVTLPLCRGAIVKAALVVFAFVFGSYEIPFLLGPTLPKALPILAYIEFQDPNIVNWCYSMALNGVTTLLCTVLAIVYFVILQREKKA